MKRSKSEVFCLFSEAWIFLAQALAANLASGSASVQVLMRKAWRAPRVSLERTMGVKVQSRYRRAWRGTSRPSMRACKRKGVVAPRVSLFLGVNAQILPTQPDTHLVVVNDLNNSSELASSRAVLDHCQVRICGGSASVVCSPWNFFRSLGTHPDSKLL